MHPTPDLSHLPTLHDVEPAEARASLRALLDALYERYDGALQQMTASLMFALGAGAINGKEYKRCVIGYLIQGAPHLFDLTDGIWNAAWDVRQMVGSVGSGEALAIEHWVDDLGRPKGRPHEAVMHLALAEWTAEWVAEHAPFQEV